MKRLSSVFLVTSVVVVLPLVANAQSGGRGPYDPYYRNYPNRGGYNNDGRYSRQGDYYPGQSGYGNNPYGFGQNQGSLIGRVIGDLDLAAANARLDSHERKHFDEAAVKLQEFEGRWAQGKFDSGKLDKAIQNLEHLAGADRLKPSDRDLLARDVNDLRPVPLDSWPIKLRLRGLPERSV